MPPYTRYMEQEGDAPLSIMDFIREFIAAVESLPELEDAWRKEPKDLIRSMWDLVEKLGSDFSDVRDDLDRADEVYPTTCRASDTTLSRGVTERACVE